jgi:hypothetical protein
MIHAAALTGQAEMELLRFKAWSYDYGHGVRKF